MVRIKGKYILRTVVGENILIPVEKTALQFSGIISLNDTGAFLWECLNNGVPLDELQEKVLNEFEATSEQAQQDIQDFLNDAVRCGLIEMITE